MRPRTLPAAGAAAPAAGAEEIVVERAKFARHAEVNGIDDQVLTMLSGFKA